MRLLKSQVLLRLLNSYLVDSPQPSNISYFWNFGSLLGVCLILQILTGVFLAMHYCANVDLAFLSVEHIMRDVSSGWLIRYTHANVASFFFIFVYLHIGRNLYYGSYKSPRVLPYSIGVIILVLMMATGFLGYKNSLKWFNKIDIKKYKKLKSKKMFIVSLALPSLLGWKATLPLVPKAEASTVKRGYCTSPLGAVGQTTCFSSNIDISERLKTILEELRLNPVYVYENLNLEDTRKQILNDTRGLSGIYLILNKITKDYYIGSASTNRFNARFTNHLIYFRGSKILKLAVKKYYLENFAFIVLDLYPNIVTKENNKELLDLEDKYLKLLVPNYNILTEAGSSFGYKHTEVDRKKIKDIYSDARRERIGNLNKGKKFSPETIEKIREKALLRHPMSDITKKKCITNTRPVVLFNLNGTVYGQYYSILDAAKSINCAEKTIRRALKTEKGIVKRQWIVKDLLNK